MSLYTQASVGDGLCHHHRWSVLHLMIEKIRGKGEKEAFTIALLTGLSLINNSSFPSRLEFIDLLS